MGLVSIIGIGQIVAREDKKDLTAKMVLGHPYKPFGRMDYFSKLGFSAIFRAMDDAGKAHWKTKRNIGLIASTRLGCLNTDQDYLLTMKKDHGIGASPALFAYTLPNCFLGEAAIFLGLTGEAFVINEDSSTGMTALSMAMTTLLADPSMEAMVCGICDGPLPGGWSAQDNHYKGALFMVLENLKHDDIPKEQKFHGLLGFDASGTILYNQTPIKDIVAINDLKGKI